MNFDRVFKLFGLIVVLAIITMALRSKQTSRIITAVGRTFTGSLKAAMGQ